MGHDSGRPAPAVTRHSPTDPHAATIDPRWAALAGETERPREEPLACPGCGENLLGMDAFETYRVCPACHRHFPLPGRERLHLLVDAGTFVETSGVLVSVDPLIFRDLLPFPDRVEPGRPAPGPGGGLGEAVITGTGRIGGRGAVLLILDHTYLGGNLGPVAAEKVVLALELAAAKRLPLVALCAASYPGFPSGDDKRAGAGILSLAQWPKIAAAAARLHQTAVPIIALLAHPTTGGVYAGLGSQADLILAEPGAHLGLTTGDRRRAPRPAPREPRREAPPGNRDAEMATAEDLLAAGQIDAVIDRRRLRATVASLVGLFADRGGFVPAPADEPPAVTGQAPRWEQITFARHPARPTGRDLVPRLASEFLELHGDRIVGDDPAMTCGLGRLGRVTHSGGYPVAIVARNRLQPTAEAPAGASAAGYRKAVRLMRLAGRFELPILILVDGEDIAGSASGEDGLGMAIAELLRLSGVLPVPIISVITGQGSGIEAMALCAGDRRLMLQHAVLTADATAPAERGRSADQMPPQPMNLMLRPQPLTAQECLQLGLVDAVVPEPEPAAHADPDSAAEMLRLVLSHTLAELSGIAPRRLLEDRGHRVRSLGDATPEGREAARREIRDLQELQRTLSRSLEDLRERWEGRALMLSRLPRPTVPHLPRPTQFDPSRLSTRVRPDLSDLAGRIADGVRARGFGPRETPPSDEDLPPKS